MWNVAPIFPRSRPGWARPFAIKWTQMRLVDIFRVSRDSSSTGISLDRISDIRRHREDKFDVSIQMYLRLRVRAMVAIGRSNKVDTCQSKIPWTKTDRQSGEFRYCSHRGRKVVVANNLSKTLWCNIMATLRVLRFVSIRLEVVHNVVFKHA